VGIYVAALAGTASALLARTRPELHHPARHSAGVRSTHDEAGLLA
jgi:hypothetical protein